ncbi:MAG: hypothetical protein WKF87_04095 [Chryseolinea sp.]
MTKKHIIILVLIATIIRCKSYGQDNIKQDFKILNLAETPMFMNIDTLKGASLNATEIASLANLADKCVRKWNEKLPIKYADGHKSDRRSEEYYKQYLPTYNRVGDKLVWINLIRKTDVKELPEDLITITDSQFYYNCWVNLSQSRICD